MSYPGYPPSGNAQPPLGFDNLNQPPQMGYPPQPTGQYPGYGAPAPATGYPPGPYQQSSGYPPYSQPPATQGSYPPYGQQQPPPQQGYPPPQQGYPPPQQGYPPPQQGYPPPQQGYPPPQQGHPPSQQGYPPTQQGYPPTQQGYPQTQQGYPPTQQGYPAPAGAGQYPPNPQTNVPQQPRGAPPQQQQGYGGQASTYPSYAAASQPAQNYGTPAMQSGANLKRTQGTVKTKTPFDAERESGILRKAMKGFGTDEKAIIDVIGYCTKVQRLQIYSNFKQCYGKDLIKELGSEISGHFLQLCAACFDKPDVFDAKQLRDAMAGIGTNESTLIEIMCTRSNAEIIAIKAAYQTFFKRNLEKDLISETSGHFKKLLVSMCNAGRDESLQVNEQKAMQDAKDLLAAGKQRMGTDESEFNRVIAARSYTHLQRVFALYQQLSGHTLEKAIKDEFSGDIKKSLKAIVKVVNDPPMYFAHALHRSMAGAGTSDTALIRIVVTRSEIDMVQIKQRFQEKYGKTLASFIKGDTSGDYERLLLTLCGEF